MWDETKQRRLQYLHRAKEQQPLSEAEEAEFSALTQERCRAEEAAIAEVARREEETNARLEAQVRQVRAQNRELEALIREQEAYRAEVEATIAGMEARRQDWRERYQKLTGRTLNEPTPAPRGG
jgi:hypothetical protein